MVIDLVFKFLEIRDDSITQAVLNLLWNEICWSTHTCQRSLQRLKQTNKTDNEKSAAIDMQRREQYSYRHAEKGNSAAIYRHAEKGNSAAIDKQKRETV